MATAEEQLSGWTQTEDARDLGDQWRRLSRAATFVAILTSPAAFVWFHEQTGWGIWKSLLATVVVIAVFRGAVDLLFRRTIPWPSLFGSTSQKLREEDIVAR